MQRTLKDFTSSIAAKWSLDPTKINRVLHILQKGLEVEVDDDVIRELAEGQDMILEILPSRPEPPKREWEMSVDVVAADNDSGTTQMPVVSTEGFELKLLF